MTGGRSGSTGRRRRRRPDRPRPALDGDTEVDVASSAAGSPACGRPTTCCAPTRRCACSWSRRQSPASGRAGATAAGARRCSRSSTAALARRHGRAAALACGAAMRDTVDEVGRCRRRGGHRLRLGQGRHGRRWPARRPQLRAGARRGARRRSVELLRRGGARDACGATRRPRRRRTRPDCARLHPARLVHGLAGAVERRGVTHRTSGTPATAVGPRRGRDRPGRRCARAVVVRATEAWTAPGSRSRAVAPVYSLIVATRAAAGVRSGSGSGSPAVRRSPTTAT